MTISNDVWADLESFAAACQEDLVRPDSLFVLVMDSDHKPMFTVIEISSEGMEPMVARLGVWHDRLGAIPLPISGRPYALDYDDPDEPDGIAVLGVAAEAPDTP